MMRKSIIAAILILLAITHNNLYSCTNFLVSKGASADGSVMISYNADAGGFMEPLYFHNAQDHTEDSVDVYDWDSGKYLGKIKQVKHTYKVVGLVNEHQVAIGETTFTGREELRDTLGRVDYGSLMFLALQRSKTAREAIKVMTDLVAEYGYYSTGESFSVADENEVWILEMIGKGPDNRGANWVAMKVPDGYVCAHANHARIREFPLNDKENCMYSKDIIEFATKKGFYDPSKGKFSFVDAYCPIAPDGLLYCEGRVWSMFRKVAPSQNFSSDYWRAVKGAEPYPLFIKPDKKITVMDMFGLMRDHFDDTEFDLKKGYAAGPFGCPVRWKPLSFKIDGDTTHYGWERPISTQQTAFSYIAQLRSFMPDELGLQWYGVDDTYSNVYIPLYTAIKGPPKAFTEGSIKQFSLESAFWIFNLVANLAYTKYSYMINDIKPVQQELEARFVDFQKQVEEKAMHDFEYSPILLTEYTHSVTDEVMRRWRELWEFLVMKYNDGYINNVNEANGRAPKGVGYDKEFLQKSVEDKPGYYNVDWKNK